MHTMFVNKKIIKGYVNLSIFTVYKTRQMHFRSIETKTIPPPPKKKPKIPHNTPPHHIKDGSPNFFSSSVQENIQ